MPRYIIYRQDTPRFIGKDRNGDNEYEANLVAVGQLVADCSDDAFTKAKRITPKPVLEEIKE